MVEVVCVSGVVEVIRVVGMVVVNKAVEVVTPMFQLEEVCEINVVAHKMKNVSDGI